ncbi:MAG TPA: IgGFc-binding protein, partial [bacterium]|nr:IgGFc-binding protein [bacterium]
AEDKSYVGCEYWGAFLQQIDENEGGTYALVVANPNATGVNVKIYTMGDTLIAENTVPAKGLYSFELGGSRKIPSAGISDLGFKLVSSKPVTVTQMNPFGNVLIYSNDATLLLPVGALAEKYYAMSWPGWSSLSGFVSIVAVQDGITTVKVTYTATSVAGAGVNAEGPGSVVSYSLNKYQILTLNSTTAANSNSYGADLTGSYIQADQKIAVFGGHVCTRIPANQQACDHMEHQIFPLQSWGKDFVAGRTKPRGGENDYFRILASENDTVVSWTGGLTGGVTLQAGWYHDFNTNTDFMIHSEKPILVGQFLASQDAGAGTGDPAMMLVAPNEQLRKDYIFLVPPNYDYNRITIIAIKDTNIEVNGQSYSSNSFMNIPGTDWYKGWVDMTTGAYTLTASKPVGLYVYGFSQYVSYAYTAGLDLKVINQQE